MPKPSILEPCIRDDDYPCFWVYRFGKSIKKGLLYLCILLFSEGTIQLSNGIECPSQIYVILLRGYPLQSTAMTHSDSLLVSMEIMFLKIRGCRDEETHYRADDQHVLFYFDLSITG